MRRRAARGAAGPSPAAEAAQLRAGLRERSLHRSWHRLPIYLVIGPSGMGKSTLLQRSGLDLEGPVELASSSWWIGEDALFAEAAADAARDGSHPVFALLRTMRPEAPACGVILVVSPADLILADVAERTEMSAGQTRLLREFETQFGYAPPLYFVLSKLDLTPGFAEFFDRLEPAEREQPWGFTLPLTPARPSALPAGQMQTMPERTKSARTETARTELMRAGRATDKDPGRAARSPAKADPPVRLAVKADAEAGPSSMSAAYRSGFRHLLDSLRARVTQWISQENDVAQCEHIVGFGAQIAALEITLRPIIEPLMASDKRRWQGAFLRGIYLTSTQQDALSIDALLPEMAKRFAMQRTGSSPPDLGRDDEVLSYFVEGMFRRVILPEAGLAQRDRTRARRRDRRIWSAVAAVLLVCAGLGVLCALSYREGVARIAGINEAVATVGPALASGDPGGLPAVLGGLAALSSLDPADAPAASPLIVSLDRYAEALIASAGEGLYDRGLANSLAPHLNARLARDLVRLDASGDALRLAIAAADRADETDAYQRWLQGAGTAGLPADRQADLLRDGAQALRVGAVPDVAPAYPTFARKLLDVRNASR